MGKRSPANGRPFHLRSSTVVFEVLIQGDSLTVQGLPAGHQVVLSGLSVFQIGAAPIVLANNQGRILLDRFGMEVPGMGAVKASSCANVQITGSRLTGIGDVEHRAGLGSPARVAERSGARAGGR